MKFKLLTATALVVASMVPALAADLPNTKAPPAAPSIAPFFFVNDNSISLSYQFTATDPGYLLNGNSKFGKSVLNFTHFDVWGYGTNFFTIDLLKSGSLDAAAPCLGPGVGCPNATGSTEIYGLFRSTLGLNQVLGSKSFSMGPLSNVSLEVGADANSENNALAPAKKSFVAGLEFSFDLPYKGFFNLSPLFYKESNHNYFLTLNTPAVPGGTTNFNGTWAVESVYSLPLAFLPEAVPLTFSGRAAFYGPKGTGSSLIPSTTANKTVTEFNSEQRLTLDIGKMAFGSSRAGLVNGFVAYRYWNHKFGIGSANDACTGVNKGSCTENAVTTGVSVKF